MICVAIILALTPIFSFSSDVTPGDMKEDEVLAIDEETAVKLAMVVSYHGTYSRASAHNLAIYGKSDWRTFYQKGSSVVLIYGGEDAKEDGE